MRKHALIWLVCLGSVLTASSSMAYTLSTNFEGVTKNSTDLLITNSATWDQWNDLVRWQIMSTGGNTGAWAQHTPNTNNSQENSLLFYGFDATGLGAGTPYYLQFDYFNGTGSSVGRVYLGGLNGTQFIDNNAPWGNYLTNDFLNEPLAVTNTWTTKTYTGFVPENFDLLFVAFNFGGTSGIRGIDNVLLTVAPVPEPSTFILLGAGLAGLAVWRKKRS